MNETIYIEVRAAEGGEDAVGQPVAQSGRALVWGIRSLPG